MFVNAINKEVARWRAEMECEELNSWWHEAGNVSRRNWGMAKPNRGTYCWKGSCVRAHVCFALLSQGVWSGAEMSKCFFLLSFMLWVLWIKILNECSGPELISVGCHGFVLLFFIVHPSLVMGDIQLGWIQTENLSLMLNSTTRYGQGRRGKIQSGFFLNSEILKVNQKACKYSSCELQWFYLMHFTDLPVISSRGKC